MSTASVTLDRGSGRLVVGLGEKIRMWNVPNSLTVIRIGLAPLLVVVLLTEFPDKEIWGLVIFLLAALTDAMDGIIARRTNRITVTGAMLDPIADKLLTSAAFISLVELGLAPAWMVTVIVGREFAITGLRLIALEHRVPISANRWGKAKTTSQIVAISLLIFGKHLGQWRVLGDVALWVAVALTLISMVVYFWQNWHIVRGAES
jgi:CDP-diacylglycerol--glycerol-3-phosphate 3-phosphatidyltransferase